MMVNGDMKNANKILKQHAPAPRMTKAAALLAALALSLPVGLVLVLVDMLLL
ncbi:hypothetical protein PhaeoP83_02188 [Phaeobacter inhibens]|uniref:Uncharacterized protein n=1 Tax=Phaeobacter inhibens TaxID=221822 RepID=A0ABM6REZ6_9RHOB|nr:hypothetical protein PhaeoP83_02188 [Phaeobacter inhibens]AUQ94994.1 hypothetical protein PhaeoP66_02220 [Phaeobacter inhibens]AUR20259.1 hypothetical protein PhaeoP80_02188 [Phaeobacter inhibens]